jgi:hypothetical protein
MQHAFAIKSTKSDAELAFTECEGDYFTVELRGREISAVRRVWGYTDCQILVELLDYLAKQDRGWTVPAEWASIESELVLRLRSDMVGHVFVEVEMSYNRGGEDWRLKAEIETELGQLPRIAREAAQFFRS